MLARLKKHWLAIVLAVFVVLPLIGFLIGSATVFTIVYWPSHFDSIDFSRFASDKEHVVVLAHGVRDDTRSWIEPLRSSYRSKNFAGDVIPVDWSAYAGSSIRCAIEGKRIGQLIGERLGKSEHVRSVHLVGHSCGAFVVYGACIAIKKQRPEVMVQVTYLDPVSVYGPDWNYGLKHFGHCADYSEAYIDTEDDVPGSNELVPNTHTYDVTAVRNPIHSNVHPHKWPTLYYRQLVESNRAPEFRYDRNLLLSKPLGVLEVVTGR